MRFTEGWRWRHACKPGSFAHLAPATPWPQVRLDSDTVCYQLAASLAASLPPAGPASLLPMPSCHAFSLRTFTIFHSPFAPFLSRVLVYPAGNLADALHRDSSEGDRVVDSCTIIERSGVTTGTLFKRGEGSRFHELWMREVCINHICSVADTATVVNAAALCPVPLQPLFWHWAPTRASQARSGLSAAR